MVYRLFMVVAALLLATACGGPVSIPSTDPPTSTAPQVSSATDDPDVETVETPEGIPVDIYVPAAKGVSAVALLLHGSPPNTREDVGVFADLVARSTGAIVYNVGWTEGGLEGVDGSVRNVACAVAFARETADAYGGDNGHITLIGMSAGGWSGAAAALGGNQLGGECQGSASPLPDAFVGIAGAYSAAIDGPVADMLATNPEALRASDPYTYLGDNPSLRVWLIHGEIDMEVPLLVAQDFRDALDENGYDPELVVLPETGHPGETELTPDNEKKVLDTIASAMKGQ